MEKTFGILSCPNEPRIEGTQKSCAQNYFINTNYQSIVFYLLFIVLLFYEFDQIVIQHH